jgi:hypothetical protein
MLIIRIEGTGYNALLQVYILTRMIPDANTNRNAENSNTFIRKIENGAV